MRGKEEPSTSGSPKKKKKGEKDERFDSEVVIEPEESSPSKDGRRNKVVNLSPSLRKNNTQ